MYINSEHSSKKDKKSIACVAHKYRISFNHLFYCIKVLMHLSYINEISKNNRNDYIYSKLQSIQLIYEFSFYLRVKEWISWLDNIYYFLESSNCALQNYNIIRLHITYFTPLKRIHSLHVTEMWAALL